MWPLILDTGALLAVLRGERRVWALVDRAEREGAEVLVPAATLAESIRGGARDAPINRLLKRKLSAVTVHDEGGARTAGGLLARTGRKDAVDALVVAEAVRRGRAMIVTSDPDDIRELARGQPDITVVRI